MELKCTKCGNPKDKSEFPKVKIKLNKLGSACKECISEIEKNRRANRKKENELYGFQCGFLY